MSDKKPITVGEMIEKYLKENGYEGLYDHDGECSCKLDNLMPCAYNFMPTNCMPGYLEECTPENCAFDGDCEMRKKEKPLFCGQGQRSGKLNCDTTSIPHSTGEVKPQAQESIALRHYGCPRHMSGPLGIAWQQLKDRAARTHP